MDPGVLLEGLDDAQRSAVTSTAMPLVVLAPAGSGKTRVLTRRIAYQVATDTADPRHVLALTFTRKAAAELSERLGRLGLRGDVTAGTFHGVAWAVLRTMWADQRRTAPTLLDRKARVLREVAGRGADASRIDLGELATEIEWAKARMITPDTYVEAAAAAGRRLAHRSTLVAERYAAYETHKQRAGLVDFDDLLALCARALEEETGFAAAQRWRFRHLFVDELQDVNALQFRLLEAWRGNRYDVTAVGDPHQAIYGWNGADAGFLLDIRRHWPPAEVIQLVRSYRATPQILGAAAGVLTQGRQTPATVEATRPDGTEPTVRSYPSDRAEAIGVARAVRRAHVPGQPWAAQAVLVRTHAQITLLAEALREAGIPHRVRGGSAFLERPALRRALRDLRDGHRPLGTALTDLEAQLAEAQLSDLEVPVGDQPDADSAALDLLVRMGRDYLRLDATGSGATFAAWLAATVQREDEGPRHDAVDLLTFHAAKGLEWPVVHLAGLEDGYVPISFARSAAAKAEEARLLYVAMTRAQKDLLLSWAEQRTFAGKVVDRRRSPLLANVTERADDHGPTSLPVPTPPVADWADELARQRAVLSRGRQESGELVALRRWREAAARAARVPPDTVLPDHVLARVAAAQPRDVAELGAIRGFGPILAARFGDEVLAALRAGVGEMPA
jgi:DNA helicase-2/ATP-dependent DNA helicase PcrA